ncbi:hypothetical protein BH09VER1_BH09VER1_27180 [soil metagenome]
MNPEIPPPIPKSPLRMVLWIIGLLLLAGVAVPVTFWAIGYFQWKKLEGELRAKGEKLSMLEMAPPAIPDAENFFSDPVWEELSDLVSEKKGGILQPRLKEGERQLDHLNPPLSRDEQQRLKAKYPEVVWAAGFERRSAVVLTAWNKKPENASPAELRRVAEFIEEVLSPAAPLFTMMKSLSKHPQARYPLRYDLNVAMPMPHVSYLLQYGQMLSMKARAEIALGQNDKAFADVGLIFYLADTMKDDPMLVPFLVRVSMAAMGIDVIAMGLKSHAWDEGALREFEHHLASLHFMEDLPKALRGERGSFYAMINELRKNKNAGQVIAGMTPAEDGKSPSKAGRALFGVMFDLFGYYDQATYGRLTQEWIERLDAAGTRGVPAEPEVKGELETLRRPPVKMMFHFFTMIMLPAQVVCEAKAAEIQDRVGMGRIACALELYWLKNHGYPKGLTSLGPELLPDIPRDVVDLQPFKYQLRSPQEYLLYSRGIDHRDDGGEPAYSSGPGDWVWGKIGKKKTAPATSE